MEKFYIIKIGNKQYRVVPGQKLHIDFCNPETPTLELDCIFDENGLTNRKIQVSVLKEKMKGQKILIWKKKRRARYEKKIGFRPQYTLVQIPGK